MFTMSHLLEEQRKFQVEYIRRKYGKELEALTAEERSELIAKQVQALCAEAFEFLDKATNWKDHRAPARLDRAAALDQFRVKVQGGAAFRGQVAPGQSNLQDCLGGGFGAGRA